MGPTARAGGVEAWRRAQYLVESLVARAVLIDERLKVSPLGGRGGHLDETAALEEPGRSAQPRRRSNWVIEKAYE